MPYRKQIYAALVVIAVTAVGTWLWRQQGATRVVPQQASLNEGGGASGNQEDGGTGATAMDSSEWARRWEMRRGGQDVGSVVGTFKEASDCLLYHSALREVDFMLNDKEWEDLSRETLATLQRMDALSARNVWLVQRLEGSCKGSDKNYLAQVFSDAVFDAALKGSPDAQTCFLLMGPSPWHDSGPIPAEKSELGRHSQYAPDFTQKALERADPRVAVRALSKYVESTNGHPSWDDGLPKPDPVLTWRAARLALLRALPEQRAGIEYRLAAFGKMGVLSPLTMTKADGWAKETFEREFSGRAPINIASAVPCYSSPDLAP